MKKSTILVLAGIMAFAFFGLIYVQIEYVRKSKNMRSDHFDEAVKRSLYQVARNLELDQTRQYLFDEVERQGSGPFLPPPGYNGKIPLPPPGGISQSYRLKRDADQYQLRVSVEVYRDSDTAALKPLGNMPIFQSPNRRPGNAITRASADIQQDRITRFIHERQNIDEVVSKLLAAPSVKPIEERINFRALKNDIRGEMKQNGIYIPFYYEVVDKNNKPIYRQTQWQDLNHGETYSQVLFSNDPADSHTYLKVIFPNKDAYIFQEVSFLVPAVIFTFILLVAFIIIITLIFRQKRLSEMKIDFMNNMTHELKTPVSTISLAAQMLKDGNITKSPEVFNHISGVIKDETERLSFQVEKVLQMSLFEKQKATLKFKDLEMNDIIASVANTFQIKVEKFGGNIDIDLQATNDLISADKMHITNVVFNLLDNAVKYRKEQEPLSLMVRTWNNNNKLYISVEDNGIGMKKDDAKRVFEQFYRVSTGNRHDVKGFGLGLAYVKKIVNDHGGSIKADSEYGVGTKFIISLPIVKTK